MSPERWAARTGGRGAAAPEVSASGPLSLPLPYGCYRKSDARRLLRRRVAQHVGEPGRRGLGAEPGCAICQQEQGALEGDPLLMVADRDEVRPERRGGVDQRVLAEPGGDGGHQPLQGGQAKAILIHALAYHTAAASGAGAGPRHPIWVATP